MECFPSILRIRLDRMLFTLSKCGPASEPLRFVNHVLPWYNHLRSLGVRIAGLSRSLGRTIAAVREQLLILTLLFALCAAFRAFTLFQSPYPTSGDVAGDLYFANVWMGSSIPGLHQPLEPPFYYFLVVIPFTHFLPVFDGTRAYMAIVPALLVFPGYAISRVAGTPRRWSYLGASLFGTSTILGLMDTWNAAFNLLGIFFLLYFLVTLSLYLRSPRRKTVVLMTVSFALVVGTHPLTAFLAVLSAASTLVIWTLVTSDPLRVRIRVLSGAVLAGVVGAAGFLPIYLSLIGGGFATVPTSAHASLAWFAETILFFPWGYQSITWNPVAIVDIVASILALSLYVRRGDLSFSLVAIGTILGSIEYAVISPTNAARALYYMFIPFSACVPYLFAWVYARRPRSSEATRPLAASSRDRPRKRTRPTRLRIRNVAALVVAAGFMVSNLSTSYNLFTAGVEHNQSLDSNMLAVVQWARTHTSGSSVFYLAPSLAVSTPWFWSLGNRAAFSQAPTSIEATTFSALAASESDYIAAGNYVMSDGSVAVGYDVPSPQSAPDLYFLWNGQWLPLLFFNAGDTFFTLLQGSHLVTQLELASGTVTSVEYDAVGSSAWTNISFWWPQYYVGLTLHNLLLNNVLSMMWTSNTTKIVAVSSAFQLLPNNYGFLYAGVPQTTNVTQLTDSLATYDGFTFSLSLTGGGFNQTTISDGWTNLDYIGTGAMVATLQGSGLVSPADGFVANATVLLHRLGINYVVLNQTYDYDFFTRVRSNTPELTGLNYTLAYSAGALAVYQLAYTSNP